MTIRVLTLQATHRRIWFHLASYWSGAQLLTRAALAVKRYVGALHALWREHRSELRRG